MCGLQEPAGAVFINPARCMYACMYVCMYVNTCILGRTYFLECSIHLIEEHWLLIITGVQASGVIIDRLLRQCCFIWSEIAGPHSSGNFNDSPLNVCMYGWMDVKLTINPVILFQAWSMPGNVKKNYELSIARLPTEPYDRTIVRCLFIGLEKH